MKPQYSAGAKLEVMVRFWSEDEACRKHLFSPIATTVRRIYKITVQRDKALTLAPYVYCPIGGGNCEDSFPTSDGHRMGSICAQGHRFAIGGQDALTQIN